MSRVRRSRRGETSGSLDGYFREVGETPLLTPDEEKSLALRVAAGDGEARDRMIRANLRLVVKIAKAYIGRGLAFQDLVGEGNLGLLRAVRKFDPAVGTRFSTYASYWIKQAIGNALVTAANTIRTPAYMVGLIRKWDRISSELQDSLGRRPTSDEIAGKMGLRKKTLEILKETRGREPQFCGFEGWEVSKASRDDRAPDLEIAKADDLRFVMDRLKEMDDHEAIVLRMYFGLDDGSPRNLKEIAESLGWSREWVRRIKDRSLEKLSALCKNGRRES